MAFRPSFPAFVSVVKKNFKLFLTAPQKRRVRKRLRDVDDVIASLLDTGIMTKRMRIVSQMPTEAETHPLNKFTTFSKNRKGLTKPITWVPKFTKTYIPREFPLGVREYLKTNKPYESEEAVKKRAEMEAKQAQRKIDDLKRLVESRYDLNSIEF